MRLIYTNNGKHTAIDLDKLCAMYRVDGDSQNISEVVSL